MENPETPAASQPAEPAAAPVTPPEVPAEPAGELPAPETPAEPAGEILAPEVPAEPAGEIPAPQSAPAPAEEQKPPKKSVLYYLFSPETRVGRFMSPFVRWLAVIVGSAGAGILLGYFLLYRPLTVQLAAARSGEADTRQQLEQVKGQLEESRSQMLNLQNNYTLLTKTMKSTNGRIQVYRMLNQVAAAQLALANREGPAVQAALQNARTELNLLLPVVKEHDPDLATQMEARLTVAMTGLNNPTSVKNDLDMLSATLLKFDQMLVSGK